MATKKKAAPKTTKELVPCPLKANEFAVKEGAKYTNVPERTEVKFYNDGAVKMTLIFQLATPDNLEKGPVDNCKFTNNFGVFDVNSSADFLLGKIKELGIVVLPPTRSQPKPAIAIRTNLSEIDITTKAVKGDHGTP